MPPNKIPYPLSSYSLFLLPLPVPGNHGPAFWSVDYLFWIFHVKGVIGNVTFQVWLLSLRVSVLRFTHIVACMKTSFLFVWLNNNEWYDLSAMAFESQRAPCQRPDSPFSGPHVPGIIWATLGWPVVSGRKGLPEELLPHCVLVQAPGHPGPGWRSRQAGAGGTRG